MDIKIASFNMHGYKNGSVMLKQLCTDLDVISVQEHWFLPTILNLLSDFCNNFTGFSVSSCLDVEAYVKTGSRPYGGIGVL